MRQLLQAAQEQLQDAINNAHSSPRQVQQLGQIQEVVNQALAQAIDQEDREQRQHQDDEILDKVFTDLIQMSSGPKETDAQ